MYDDGTAAISEVELERTYNRAGIYAIISLCSVTFLAIGIVLLVHNPPPLPIVIGEGLSADYMVLVSIITVLVSFLTFVASAIGTASTVLLGWRAERRQSEEFKLKIKQLELQLQETQAKLVSPPKDISTSSRV
jgi:hypothetical protein